MISPRLLAPLVTLAVVAACSTLVAPAAARSHAATVAVQTVPALEGVSVERDGRVRRTDASGVAEFRVRVPHHRGRAILRPIARSFGLRGVEVASGVRARLGRWYALGGWSRPLLDSYVLHAALDLSYALEPRFVDPSGRAVDPTRVASVVVESSDGVRHAFRGTERPSLHGTRVVRSGPRLRSKDIRYSVERVIVDGASVIDRGQLRFFPRRARELTMRLRFFSARFVVRDALFGFAQGSAIRVRFPSGRVERHELDADGEVGLASLPRGDYEVEIEAPGLPSTTPVALSRPQEVELKVLSYLDIVVVLTALSVAALALFLAGRPSIRERVGLRLAALGQRRYPDRNGDEDRDHAVEWITLPNGRTVRLTSFDERDEPSPTPPPRTRA